MKRVFMIFMIILLAGFTSCIFDDPPENNDPVDVTKYGYVTPSEAKLGTRLKFFTTDSLPYPIEEYQILFSGLDEFIPPDSIVNENIYVTLPFGTVSGKAYMLHVEYDSSDFTEGQFPLKNTDTVFISALQVDEISNPKDIRLTWSNFNYRIYKSQSQFRYGVGSSQNIEWQGEVKGDTTFLSSSYQIGDITYEHHISFYSIRTDDYLPEFMSARSRSSYSWRGIEVVENDYFYQGVIKLQDWDPDTLVTGRIITDRDDMNNIYFWCDFSE